MEFLAWCRFGRGDSGETYVEVALTDEEIDRMAAQNKEEGTFEECEAVRDIYDRVYEAAVNQITEELREADKMGMAYLEEGQRADDVYAIGVNWPEN